ncbi:hypothetical protein COU19_01655 [Candidatus Kaiserbacteria bacterium CG10_big_fil_rev_8_21_14_0_10_56_12]|uniref:Uncharacterized protein n=1 Tax=Candidatus Kaiserbacteria bacterium CG10_big_fil_rev_8_21_14_0_10_56_12 TaxID=1974611 RepID=A0A2H0UA12_9BACT|nr:MAG: hypothetical protein COU19_01655 [Candidatus Kaiserbacteria bacterium CG10_big_fil_rev_8_21_14_0_10_56_12]
MTVWRAAPLLVGCIALDAVRAFFVGLWIFAPALGAFWCTSAVNGALGTSVAGDAVGKEVFVGCSTAAGVAGGATSEFLAPFGAFLAIIAGIFGWLAVGFFVALFYRRTIRAQRGRHLWLFAGLVLTEVPFLDIIPGITVVMWRMIKRQIKVEKKALREWEKVRAATRARERQEQIAAMSEARARQQAQAQEVATTEQAEEEIPEDGLLAT